MRIEKLSEIEASEINDRISDDKNVSTIYEMLHTFRNWNREWDTWMKNKPKTADDFVNELAKNFDVRKKPV